MNNPYLIGLTGNLGSGKSTVRRQLEEYGAHSIDADLLTHQVMQRGTPAWFAILRQFGLGILKLNGEISRQKLAARVFADPQALAKLERVLHPAVTVRIKRLLRDTNAPIVVIEAIKLIEAGLHTWCDAIWIVTCEPKVQIERVVRDRHMSVEDARARMQAQGLLDEKLKLATVVIDNSGDANTTRIQVQRAWQAVRPEIAREKAWLYDSTQPVAQPIPVAAVPHAKPIQTVVRETPSLEIRRAHKSDLAALGAAFAKREHLSAPLVRADTLARFGSHGYRIAISRGQIAAFVAWDVENLVAVAHEVWAENKHAARALPQLLTMIEDEARHLHCEVLLVVIDPLTPSFVIDQTRDKSYLRRDLKELHRVWRQVAMERVKPEDQLLVKLLRKELVTQPF